MKPIIAILAAGILLGMTGQVAYAQLPTAFDVQLAEDMSLGDAIVVAQAVSFELTETIGLSDVLDQTLQPGTPQTHSRSINDAITIQEGESVSKQAASPGSGGGSGSGGGPGNIGRVARSVSDGLSLDERIRARHIEALQEPPEPAPEPVPEPKHEQRSIDESITAEESVFLSGSIVPPAAPQLIVSGGELAFNMESAEVAVITFVSSSTGNYRIAIVDDAGETAATLSGQMAIGENNARWPGTGTGGRPVPDGTYTYFITANNDVGTRTPPREGDGTIVVSGSPEVQFQGAPVDWTTFVIIMSVAAAGAAGAFLFSRRRSKLVVYLPAGATPVIDEIRERYPSATVEEYVTPHDGGTELIKGVAIPDPKPADQEWFSDIIQRAKELAGVDSINISHKGKVRPV
jgi:hypothetical protein